MKPDSETRPFRILIVDDHPVVREGIVRLLEHEPDLSVCGEAEESTQATKLIEKTRPDLVLLDLSLKKSGGIGFIQDLRNRYPSLLLLVLSIHDESVYAERALRAGAQGFVMKHEATQNVVQAIRSVLAGEIYLSPRMSSRILGKIVKGQPKELAGEVNGLSNRELDVFRLIGEGLSNRKIASQLSISVKTVEAHREHMKAKLGLASGADLVQHAVLWVNRGGKA